MLHFKGFTLIELLVVVTIIVVLLALLTPALDRAIYQAELAACGAKVNGIAMGTSVYAAGNKRFYPYRPGVRDDVTWPAAQIYNGSAKVNAWNASAGNRNLTVFDDRATLRSYLSLKAGLIDPLCGKIDLESIDDDSTAYANYSMWFGYQFFGQPGGTGGMRKIGDRLESFDVRDTPNDPSVMPRKWRLDVLVSDYDQAASLAGAECGHPDYDGFTALNVFQNQDAYFPQLKEVRSAWFVSRTGGRGPNDLNYAMQDGSVERFLGVGQFDTTMAYIQNICTGAAGWFHTMPQQK